jgi:hypothetical protein
MTWNPADAARQTNTRGKRSGQRVPLETPSSEHRRSEPDAMPTILAGMDDGMFDADAYGQRMPMEQEKEMIGMGFVPERQWNLVRQWMFRGITPL